MTTALLHETDETDETDGGRMISTFYDRCVMLPSGPRENALPAPISSAVTQEAALEGAAIFCTVSVSPTSRQRPPFVALQQLLVVGFRLALYQHLLPVQLSLNGIEL
jgi:hypothetical protein